LILGLTALISPIAVSSRVLVKELPILFMTTLIAGYQLIDKEVTGTDGWVLLFSGILSRDFLFMIILTFSLFAIGYGFRGQGRINRYEGAILTASYGG
jgi:Ca2+/Na+ antiporter